MKPNVGERDKLLRTILGVYGMLLGFLFVQGVVGILIVVRGVLSLATAPLKPMTRSLASYQTPLTPAAPS